MDLTKAYTPGEIENKWYPNWETNGYFKPSMDKNAPSYCIQLPPPNVTGTLHMGHAFQQTIMDILIRFHRMKGYNTLWQAGVDHAGIATQIVVERQLEKENLTRHGLGRAAFIERVWQWKNYSGDTITRQMRRLGSSCDWTRQRFTMDKGLSEAVNEVFITWYRQGYIYKGKRLVNWDIQLQTAVSDLEVISSEEDGSLWHIRYLVKDSDESIVVATTRPETMLGDVAVAVNPNDERYKHLVGKNLILPLVGREIPIISDEYVDKDFGTGCVKITPAHDFNDYDIGKRHNLAIISILDLDGKINQNAPQKYQGMDRFAAREEIIINLKELNLLVKVKPHKLMVPRSDRTNVVIEPMLTNQWFVNMDKFAKRALELVENGQIKFVPENWKKTYDQWLEKIQDWCISRQLWWGHRIPAYYDKEGNIYVAKTLKEAIIQAGTSDLKQDEDVLDTWFSSGLWAFSTLDWPLQTKELDMFLPSNVLVTGFDIIFFWVARMVMMTDNFTGKVPFKEIYINGLIMDAYGNKMSKSKGNVIDPLDIINGINLDQLLEKRIAHLMNPKQAEIIKKQTEKDYPNGFMAFGADALRFSLASLATQARYINFDLKRIEGSRNFCNKLWNAAKFVIMNAENNKELIGKPSKNAFIDNWVCNQLNNLIIEVEIAFKTYRFDLACQKIYEFVWNDYCDWYLELAKVNLQSDDINAKTATINTLVNILEAVLRVIHPIMPFISEEIWQTVAVINNKKTTQSIMLAQFPSPAQIQTNNDELDIFGQMKQIISIIRNLRAEMNLLPALKVPLLIATTEIAKFELFDKYIKALARISEINLVENINNSSAPIAVFQNNKLMLKVEVDIEIEKSRLNREIDKSTKELEKIQVKLNNPNFIERAPVELVERERVRVRELDSIIKQLTQQLIKIV